MPSEVDEGKVSRHWHDEVKGIAVDDAFPHIVQLSHQTCGRREKEQRVKCGIALGLMGGYWALSWHWGRDVRCVWGTRMSGKVALTRVVRMGGREKSLLCGEALFYSFAFVTIQRAYLQIYLYMEG